MADEEAQNPNEDPGVEGTPERAEPTDGPGATGDPSSMPAEQPAEQPEGEPGIDADADAEADGAGEGSSAEPGTAAPESVESGSGGGYTSGDRRGAQRAGDGEGRHGVSERR